MAEQVNGRINIDSKQVEDALKLVTNLTKSLDSFIEGNKKVVDSVSKQSGVMKATTKATKDTNTAMGQFNKASQDLTKSVQVALGPLSGVAARITALTALFNRNTFAAAAVIGAFTGFTVATKKLVLAGMEHERLMLRMEAVTASLGDRASFTASQLEGFAQTLAGNTLAGLNNARDAVTVLSTFTNILPENFGRAASAAEAMSSVFGGQLSSSVRQVGILLEDPIRNMETLRRRGIQFTKTERDKIESLVRTGRAFEAQTLVLEKFEAAIAASEGAAGGLAGSLDTASQLFQNFFEKVNIVGGVTDGVNNNIIRINESLKGLLENDRLIATFGTTFDIAGRAVSRSLELITANINTLVPLLGAMIALFAAQSVVAFLSFAKSLTFAALGVKTFTAAITTLIAAVKGGGIVAGVAAVGFGALLKVFALAAVAIGSFTLLYKSMNGATEEVTESTKAFSKEIEELRVKIESIPKDVRVNISVNTLDNMSNAVAKTRRDIAEVEKKLAELSRRREIIATGSLGQGSRGSIRALDRQIEELENRLGMLGGMLQISEGHLSSFTDEINEAHNAVERFGGRGLQGTVDWINELTTKFLPSIAKAKEFSRTVGDLNILLEDLNSGSARAEGIIKLFAKDQGIEDLEEAEKLLRRIISGVLAGGESAKSAKNDIDGLSNSFADLQFNIRQSVDELLGLTNTEIAPSLMRQFEQLSSGQRGQLAELGVTPQSMQSLQDAQKGLNELQSYMNKLRQDEMSEVEKIRAEQDQMLNIITQIEQSTGRNLSNIRAQVNEYASGKIVEELKKEQAARVQAARETENIYKKLDRDLRRTELSRKDFALAAVRDEYQQRMADARQYFQRLRDLNLASAEEIARIEADLTERIRKNYEDLKQETEETFNAGFQAAQRAAQDMQQAFADYLFDPFNQSLNDMLRNFVNILQRMASEALANKVFESLFGGVEGLGKAIGGVFTGKSGGGGSIGNIVGDVIGSIVNPFKGISNFIGGLFADGGMVRGPGTSTSDSIPAWLSNGEFVLNARATRMLGSSTLNALNEGRVAKFADGGYVGNNAGSTMSNNRDVRIINVIDPDLVREYMNGPGGDDVLINLIHRNSGTVRQLLI